MKTWGHFSLLCCMVVDTLGRQISPIRIAQADFSKCLAAVAAVTAAAAEAAALPPCTYLEILYIWTDFWVFKSHTMTSSKICTLPYHWVFSPITAFLWTNESLINIFLWWKSWGHTHTPMLSCSCVYVCLWVCLPCECTCLQKPEEGVGAPVTGVTGGCEWPDMHSGHRTIRTACAFNKWAISPATFMFFYLLWLNRVFVSVH